MSSSPNSRAVALACMIAVACVMEAACAPAATPSSEPPGTPSAIAAKTEGTALMLAWSDSGSIRVQRSGCYGTCPAYSLTIRSTGDVLFEPVSNTRQKEPAHTRIDPDSARTLFGQLTDRRFFSLSDRYASGTAACLIYRTDAPTILLTVSAGISRKTVLWETGCQDAPDVLAWLSGRVDELSRVRQWL